MSDKTAAFAPDARDPEAYRLVSWACLFTALAHAVATLAGLYLVRTGSISVFSPLRLMRFVPDHIVAWKLTLLATVVATVSFVVFMVAFREILNPGMHTLLTLAIILVAIAAANDLIGQGSMMILFSDLSYQLKEPGSLMDQEIVHLGWAVINLAITLKLLIANGLYAISGILLMVCAFKTKNFPRWITFIGWPIWTVSLIVTAVAFQGHLKFAMIMMFASGIAFVFWCTLMGVTFRLLAKPDIS